MQIIGDELIKMFYTSMTDNKMIEIIDICKLEQPLIDEEYELYKSVTTYNNETCGVGFTFRELDECEQESPCLAILSWSNEKNIKPPFGLSFSMSYKDCCQVLGKKADYKNKRIKKLKTWIIEDKDNTKYIININFMTTDFINFRSIGVVPFDKNQIDDRYIKNEE